MATINFTVNKNPCEVSISDFPPATTLLQYLRESGLSTGTKGCCYTGACGVCVVSVTRFTHGEAKHCAVNACCQLLYSCEGLEVTTVEGLGSVKGGLHPIQERLASHDGVQCGYCTPGQVMNMHGLLKENPTPTMQQVEDAFDANICRCTGYRPILDAMKSFAVDRPNIGDIEDLTVKRCEDCPKLAEENVNIYDDGCMRRLESGNTVWLSPASLAQLHDVLETLRDEEYRLVCGHTGFGVRHQLAAWNYKTLVDIQRVEELNMTDIMPSSHIQLGANLTLTDLLATLETLPELPYSKAFISHIKLVASHTVRNLGSWAGNIMVKHFDPLFASDIFTLLAIVEGKLNISSSGSLEQVSLASFMMMDMRGRVLESVELPKYGGERRVVHTYRTSHRLQQCEASVVSGFNVQFDQHASDHLVVGLPVIVVQLKGNTLIHCNNTAQLMVNERLWDSLVLQECLRVLSEELRSGSEGLKNQEYLVALAVNHFYKFVLHMCQPMVSPALVSGGECLEREVMGGRRELGERDDGKGNHPASTGMMKVTAPNLTTGEVKYVDDLAPPRGQLCALPVLSTVARATLAHLDMSQALQVKGVKCVIQAGQIPGINNWRPFGWCEPGETQQLLCDGEVLFSGQPLGIVVAEDERSARQALGKVKVTYDGVMPVVVDLQEAINVGRFHAPPRTFTKGDTQAGLTSGQHRLRGRVKCGSQCHLHLENQVALADVTDTGGIQVKSSCQWLDYVQECVSQVCGVSEAEVTVGVTRLGGAFGGKIFHCAPIAGMCAVAAKVTQAPCRMALDLTSNLHMQGARPNYVFDYEVAFDDQGKLEAIDVKCYIDVGAVLITLEAYEAVEFFIDNCYFCPNWSVTVYACHTDKVPTTSVRAPGSSQSIFAMESMLDHVTSYLSLDPLVVRRNNLFIDGQMTMLGTSVERPLTGDVITQLEQDCKYLDRLKEVEEFNRNNRWRKRGVHIMPSIFNMTLVDTLCYNTTVSIYHGDGSVIITHGGIDMGQGINTKAIQVCSLRLGVPMDTIKVAPSCTTTSPNSWFSGASITSEMICMGVLQCCQDLTARMQPIREELGAGLPWGELVQACFKKQVDLTGYYRSGVGNRTAEPYSCYSACCTEVELDVLTGQYAIRQVDYICDAGQSLNPRLDMGQLEGGFVMGMGLFLLEGEREYDEGTGELLTSDLWTYKPPMPKDLPVTFNTKFLRNAPNPKGVLGAKAVGETPVVLGACPVFALKRAIEAARREAGVEGCFTMDSPATVQRVFTACGTETRHLALS